MTDSPLKFAQEFEKFRTALNAISVPDRRLLLMTVFWPNVEPNVKASQYSSYLDEYSSLLKNNLSDRTLFDLTIEELTSIRAILLALCPSESSSLSPSLELVTRHLITQLFYVGAVDRGLSLCVELTGQGNSVNVDDSEIEGLSAVETLDVLAEQYESENTEMARLLREIHRNWEAERFGLHNDRIWCLFVEKDGHSRTMRGRMRQLVGDITPRSGESDESDTVTFDHQVRSPDDPYVGVSYDALRAIRTLLQRRRQIRNAHEAWQAHFCIDESQHAFTGDSIGLAFGLLTYTQLLKTEITRHERFVSSDIAVTGGLDAQGQVQSVNRESLGLKIRRAFFSHASALVVPLANQSSARYYLDRLAEQYPRRRLHLIAQEKLADAGDDLNIVRAEKVCWGQFVTRKAYRYSRATRLQVPILLCLGWFLLALLWPKYFDPWFDHHIAQIAVEGNYFRTKNANGQTIWVSDKYDFALDQECYQEKYLNEFFHHAVDLDRNGKDELFFAPVSRSLPPRLQFYDDRGRLAWDTPCVVKTTYPGDTEFGTNPENMHYGRPYLVLYQNSDSSTYVISQPFASSPGRTQVLCFDPNGNIVSGPYIFPGSIGFNWGIVLDINDDGRNELVGAGVNNRYDGNGLVIIDPLHLEGVSPPFENDLFLASGMPRGNQLVYVHFPETPLSEASDIRNCVLYINFLDEGMSSELQIVEGYGLTVDGKKLRDLPQLPKFFYYLDSNFIPTQVIPNDGVGAYYNQLMDKTGRVPCTDFDRLCDSLRSEIVVYYGDSIVHHETSGIDFYGGR